MTLTALISINSILLHLNSLILTEGTPAVPIPTFLTALGAPSSALLRFCEFPSTQTALIRGWDFSPYTEVCKLEVSSHHVHLMLPWEVMSQHYKPNAWSILMSIFLFFSAHREITGAGKWNLCSVACFCHLCPSSYWHKGVSFLLKLPHGYPVLVHALGVKFAPMEFHVTLVLVLLVCQLKNST